MKHLAILGASGHGKVVADVALAQGWQQITFFDDAWPSLSRNSHWALEGGFNSLQARIREFDGIIVAIGDNRVRNNKLNCLRRAEANLVSLVHPTAWISPYATIGDSTVVMANAVINVDARVGDGSIVNTGAVIEHDCDIAECAHLSPNSTLAGGVSIGRRAWVGAGASVRELVRVGDDARVGMGSVVINDVANGSTVVGVPAEIR